LKVTVVCVGNLGDRDVNMLLKVHPKNPKVCDLWQGRYTDSGVEDCDGNNRMTVTSYVGILTIIRMLE
jgi:hypothetical protein